MIENEIQQEIEKKEKESVKLAEEDIWTER